MTIPAYRLPPGIERGARGGPEFKNIILTAVSGREQRMRQWAKARARFDIAYGIRDSTDPVGDFAAVRAVFYAHNGTLEKFPFKDWSDYQANDDKFGTGDGSTVDFQLGKIYDPSEILLGIPGSLTYFRPLYAIVGTPIIKVNGVVQTVTTHYTINSSGLVTFTSAPAGGSPAAELTWTGEFDLLVRFDTDYLPVLMTEDEIVQIDTLPIRELIGET